MDPTANVATPCQRICPVDALFTNEFGRLHFLPDQCLGCHICSHICKSNSLQINVEMGMVLIDSQCTFFKPKDPSFPANRAYQENVHWEAILPQESTSNRINYTFTHGSFLISLGVMGVPMLAQITGMAHVIPLGKYLGALMSMGFLLLTLVLGTCCLEKPFLLKCFLAQPNLRSWVSLSWLGGLGLAIFHAVYLYAMLIGWQLLELYLVYVGMTWLVVLVFLHAQLLAKLPPILSKKSLIQATHLTLISFSLGAGTWTLLCLFFEWNQDWVVFVGVILSLGLTLELVFLGIRAMLTPSANL